MKLGIVGVGRMGGAMWRHLRDLGHDPVVHDLNTDAVRALAAEGATAVSSPAEVARQADAVILSLPRSDDVHAAVLGDEGIATGARPDTLVLDTTSGAPRRSREIAAACAARGLRYVDAGVSGGVHGAASGGLSIMVGADDADFDAAKPVLDLLGQRVWHCGPPGTGHAMKTVLNLSNQGKMLLEIEALLVGRAAGLDAHQMAEVLGLSTWQHFLMGTDGRRPFGFSLGMSCKDYDVGIAVAEDEDVPVRVLAAAHQTMHAILDAIGPDADIVDYVSVLEHDAGVELPNHGHDHSDEEHHA
jgi:3-hydroxyisobutyrate dehydrogenase-like beta-hydroxyacid dehydrogenase